ncbi:MAG TPA: sulfotransferase domain-containing protein [Parafilimonas sp.]|nr:sulfotransferase domain-containing protein [Parafilimonas sp.]
MKNEIDLMIIGAQKAGTTSLNRYLSQHPKIYTHYTQEFGMFSSIENYEKGLAYYIDQCVSDERKKLDDDFMFFAKTVGLMYKPELLNKLRGINPDIKVVLVLRNPIERAFSAFWYCKKNGLEPYDTFKDAIYVNDPGRFKNERFQLDCDYIGRSKYSVHLKNVYSIFPAENVKILLFEEMITDLNKYLNEICHFKQLDQFEFNTSIKYNEGGTPKSVFLSRLLSPGKNTIFKNILSLKNRTKLKQVLKSSNSRSGVSAPKEKMDKDVRKYLQNVFREDVEDLANNIKLPIKSYWKEFF